MANRHTSPRAFTATRETDTSAQPWWKSLGPGIITGAADDDPSGIATYTQTGAQFGYGQLWTALFMLPFMIAVQATAAKVAAVNGKGLAGVIKQHYSRSILYVVSGLLLVANTINIGADLGAMAAATQLLVPLPFWALILGFTLLTLILEIFTSYRTYKKVLLWLSVTLIAYPLTVFITSQPWADVLRATFIPHITFSRDFFFLITAVFGTTISPYMFFWQASEQVEEERATHVISQTTAQSSRPTLSRTYLRHIKIDSIVGMVFSELATWSIIVVAATVLHQNGVTQIATAADAARAIEPLVQTFTSAGTLAKAIFALGVIGLGLLSIPVLSGSAAYALAETFDWPEGLNKRPRQAPQFYAVITLSLLVGLGMNFLGFNPIRALIITAVINAIVAVPLLGLLAHMSGNPAVMGQNKSWWATRTCIWITMGCMLAAVVGLGMS